MENEALPLIYNILLYRYVSRSWIKKNNQSRGWKGLGATERLNKRLNLHFAILYLNAAICPLNIILGNQTHK